MEQFDFIVEQIKHQSSGLGPVYGFAEKTPRPYTPTLNSINETLKQFSVDPTLSGIPLESADFMRTLAKNQDILVYLKERMKDKDINVHSPAFEKEMMHNMSYLSANYARCNDMSVQAKHFNTASIQQNLSDQIEKANELFAVIRPQNPDLANNLSKALGIESHVEKLSNKVRDISVFTPESRQEHYASMGMGR